MILTGILGSTGGLRQGEQYISFPPSDPQALGCSERPIAQSKHGRINGHPKITQELLTIWLLTAVLLENQFNH
jgi:hypothetical protein